MLIVSAGLPHSSHSRPLIIYQFDHGALSRINARSTEAQRSELLLDLHRDHLRSAVLCTELQMRCTIHRSVRESRVPAQAMMNYDELDGSLVDALIAKHKSKLSAAKERQQDLVARAALNDLQKREQAQSLRRSLRRMDCNELHQ
ncbi:hypothetical protein BJG93_36250 [Paraburkholderia sprentiae WSM5005]|uniref:Uncharacterized protein n=2 Tax=Paraburkholderia sprentiae WSM5005 TaxID=754502 RepID=A0A8F4KJS6_9BURK|nr:hypothetical protein [Paraburkholderia sprentiae]QXE07266.1 hypothetical protein BJG93_36250 [Paraburkholderia sprentiae WSM5005]